MDILHRRERQKANKERAREKARGYIAEYFATHSCTDCGESDPIILTFDHLPDRDKKRADISLIVRDGLGLEAIKAEIEMRIPVKSSTESGSCRPAVEWSNAGEGIINQVDGMVT